MKKWIFLIIAMLSIVSFSACSKKNETKEEKPENNNVTETKKIDTEKEKSTSLKAPFFLYYEKVITEPDSKFRFEVKIIDEKVHFTINDSKYGKHFVKEHPLEAEKIEKLKEEIKKTEFNLLVYAHEVPPRIADHAHFQRTHLSLSPELIHAPSLAQNIAKHVVPVLFKYTYVNVSVPARAPAQK